MIFPNAIVFWYFFAFYAEISRFFRIFANQLCFPMLRVTTYRSAESVCIQTAQFLAPLHFLKTHDNQEFTQENYHTIGTSCPRSGCADCCVYHVATEHFVVAGPGEWGLEGPPGRGNPTPDPSHLGKEEGKLMEACPIAIK